MTQFVFISNKLICLFITCTVVGQPFVKAQAGYTLVGSARSGATATCIQLTNSGNSQVGATWFDKQLDLTKSFELSFTINLGSNPAGADGIVMVFQTQGNQALGAQAGGIGYGGLRPSMGVEFDTNQNFELGDPAEDHIVLLRDGISDHRINTGFAAPVPISATQNNVKDGRDHSVNVRWDAISRILRVEVDCIQRISQSIDLVNSIFLGTSQIIWGFTSATGGLGNTHTVCLPEVRSDTISACRNDQITLTAPLSSNGQYLWAPGINLDNSQTRSPRLKVTDSQLYTVQYMDRCGQPKLDTVFVKAKGVMLSIGDDRQVCENDSVTLISSLMPANIPVMYRWSTGQTTSQLKPTTSGQYSLTITADGCSVSDSARVTFISLPKLGLSTEPVYDCPGSQPIQLDPQITGPNLQYSWTPGASKEPTLMADAPGLYTVQITAGKGCSSIQRFTILNNCPSIVIFVPDAFTPNGDGMNDVFAWKGASNLTGILKVFDRWGEVLFMSTEFSTFWDGTYRGTPCPPSVYTWSLEYWSRLAPKQSSLTTYGRVLLLR